MNIDDLVYGTQEITDAAAAEIIATPQFQRLKRIGQGGVLGELSDPQCFTRYEHSIGALLLLQRLGASRNEQIAGLLHDVSHTAFSHTVDYVLGDPLLGDFQDRTHDRYITSTAIPAILAKHGLPKDCAQHPTAKRFPLLEQDAPLLCADRVDYTLRNAWHRDMHEHTSLLLSALTVHDNRIVFSSSRAAEAFWRLYDRLQENKWAEHREIARAQLLGDALEQAMKTKLLSMADLYQDDVHVTGILRASHDPCIQECLMLLDKGFSLVRDERNPNYRLRQKFRRVDPEFLENGRLRKVSEVFPSEYGEWLDRVRAQEKYTPNGFPVRILPA